VKEQIPSLGGGFTKNAQRKNVGVHLQNNTKKTTKKNKNRTSRKLGTDQAKQKEEKTPSKGLLLVDGLINQRVFETNLSERPIWGEKDG